jgi:dTDP-4-dehydrorhamnose reductase
MKSVLITGCNGLLGQNLVKCLKGWEIFGTDVHSGLFFDSDPTTYIKADITSRSEVMDLVEELRPGWIINTAAITDVDGCESRAQTAYQINCEGAANLAEACRRTSCRLLQISTDYVFDGTSGPYREDDKCVPLSVYGKSKYKAEEEIRKTDIGWLIVRTIVLFGTGIKTRTDFIGWVIDSLGRSREIRVVNDQLGNITLASNLSENIRILMESDRTGIFHVSGADVLSRYDIALEAAGVFDLNRDLILPCTTEELGQSASRPLRSGFYLDKIRSEPGTRILSARELLNEYLTETREQS